MKKSKKIPCINKECVSCGACVRVCPFGAITIHKGLIAVVDEQKCVGCGKCAKECPAGVITMMEVDKS